jgi:demethylmenaquinone methyltransferase/2-methoxy-6-polyprenyl-1,4-benzoquinol methylase
VLSASIDRLWWWRTARRFRAMLADPDAAVLDICCGTGDMTMALLKRRPAGARPVIAADFAREMLARGARNSPAHLPHTERHRARGRRAPSAPARSRWT